MRSTRLLFAGAVLVLGAGGCGADNPAGTLSQDDLPGGVEVAKVVKGDDQDGQVVCPAVNDAEDDHVMTPSDNYDKDRRAAVTYRLSGAHDESLSSSVWRLARPKEAVAQVAAGLERCVQDQPGVYRRFRVSGHPGALGYTEAGGGPTATYTRRLLVPLSDRVVIVTSTREGGSDFTVAPEDVLDRAIEVSDRAPAA
jgi:hypothetical protein